MRNNDSVFIFPPFIRRNEASNGAKFRRLLRFAFSFSLCTEPSSQSFPPFSLSLSLSLSLRREGKGREMKGRGQQRRLFSRRLLLLLLHPPRTLFPSFLLSFGIDRSVGPQLPTSLRGGWTRTSRCTRRRQRELPSNAKSHLNLPTERVHHDFWLIKCDSSPLLRHFDPTNSPKVVPASSVSWPRASPIWKWCCCCGTRAGPTVCLCICVYTSGRVSVLAEKRLTDGQTEQVSEGVSE